MAGFKKVDKVMRDQDGKEIMTITTWEYKFWDKGQAIDRGLRSQGAYSEKVRLEDTAWRSISP